MWRGADWFEREGHDLFVVVFEGHPDLSPLLLYEGFEGHPGRKSFPFHDYDEWEGSDWFSVISRQIGVLHGREGTL